MRLFDRLFGACLLAAMLALATIPTAAAQAAQPAHAASFDRETVLDAPGWLEARIALLPLDDPGRFDLTVVDWEGNVVATANQLGHGGTTGALSVPPGLYSLSQEASDGVSLGIYISDIECRDGANQELVVASCTHCAALSDIPVASDSSVLCTVRNVNAQPPLAATIAQFDATCQEGTPLLAWITEHEVDVQGFNLYRGVSLAQPDVQINPDLIPAAAPGSPQGTAYSWVDLNAPPDALHAYWLEVLSLDGRSTLLPPVAVTCLTPTAVRLAALEATTPAGPGLGVGALVLTLVALAASRPLLRLRNPG
jgi:hypothetical protein